ncbi:hypothetical protein GWK16_14795 [Roseomonas sp. JC162]|uniref:Uncharacterized protein n=1 Tax=Neoroseomonas marina TaxID=1232220 RepID=A0A848ED66_9PROT|nr:hypothetical protein [Neoroseomonas marina]NMJ42514.1 hypothetical protein [Neoroseomonas marina]
MNRIDPTPGFASQPDMLVDAPATRDEAAAVRLIGRCRQPFGGVWAGAVLLWISNVVGAAAR